MVIAVYWGITASTRCIIASVEGTGVAVVTIFECELTASRFRITYIVRTLVEVIAFGRRKRAYSCLRRTRPELAGRPIALLLLVEASVFGIAGLSRAKVSIIGALNRQERTLTVLRVANVLRTGVTIIARSITVFARRRLWVTDIDRTKLAIIAVRSG